MSKPPFSKVERRRNGLPAGAQPPRRAFGIVEFTPFGVRVRTVRPRQPSPAGVRQ